MFLLLTVLSIHTEIWITGHTPDTDIVRYRPGASCHQVKFKGLQNALYSSLKVSFKTFTTWQMEHLLFNKSGTESLSGSQVGGGGWTLKCWVRRYWLPVCVSRSEGLSSRTWDWGGIPVVFPANLFLNQWQTPGCLWALFGLCFATVTV